ncbi:MAG: winged helix-turn-helix transcriptional regulator [Pseudolabrys sp.]
MPQAAHSEDADQARIMLGLLDSVERDGAQSQRHLASELGIALGLVNAYIKKCVKKGLLKASQAPARRYVYYLTPHGFAEKSRLTVEYLSSSFGFFRQAKADCAAIFQEARSRGFDRVVLAGKSDLAEIASICALESGVTIVAIVDRRATMARFIGLPVLASYAGFSEKPDAVVVTDLVSPQETCEEAIKRVGADRVLIPSLLRVRLRRRRGSAR